MFFLNSKYNDNNDNLFRLLFLNIKIWSLLKLIWLLR